MRTEKKTWIPAYANDESRKRIRKAQPFSLPAGERKRMSRFVVATSDTFLTLNQKPQSAGVTSTVAICFLSLSK
jgi:hypothetical protein